MRAEAEKVIAEIEKVIAGKRDVIAKILTALLAEGHVLLDDVPGVGKTTLAVALSRAVGLAFRRVQCTPDVLPSDLVGFSMYEKETGSFKYRPGALNGANLVLVDEINRASSKTQSALLEAMEEKQVTVDGNTYRLETPFLVIATQNSVGAAGTQLLPYAQADRFLTRFSLGYPDHDAQMTLLRDRLTGDPLDRVERVLSRDEFVSMQKSVRSVTVKDAVLDYVTRLAMASRAHKDVEVGVSPRGALFTVRAACARAWTEDRDYVTGADVAAVFRDVCAHRLLLKKDAGDRTPEDTADELLRAVESCDRHSRFGVPGKR